jgi:hypothetical protein
LLISIEPSLLESGTLKLEALSGDAKFKVWESATKGTQVALPQTWDLETDSIPSILYLEGVVRSDAIRDIEIRLRYTNGGAIADDAVKATTVGLDLIPDYNRDRKIDQEDKDAQINGTVFYFWINDDDDETETSGNDTPEQNFPDHDNVDIDSVRDLVDFFPVFLDLKNTLDLLGTTNYTYALEHGGNSSAFIYTDLTPATAGQYLTDVSTAASLTNEAVFIISGFNNGSVIDQTFSDEIQNNGKGIILVEGINTGSSPLRLNIIDANNNIVYSKELSLSLSGVEEMFRHVNLVDDLDAPEQQAVTVPDRFTSSNDEPGNYPDNLSNGKNFVFLHGYNVDQQAARGWHAEIFKRLFWAGSKAKFVGVTWHGNVGANYHRAVINAFTTSENLAGQLSFLTGEITIGAHSLGNMVVSEAIANGGFNADRYFMFNAAVAIEAYDPTQLTGQNNVNMKDNIRNPDWDGYDEKLWASKWYQLFSGPDNRQELTWNDRFASVINMAYNFYSEGEDVVRNADGEVPSLIGDLFLANARNSWALQEMIKGLDGPLGLFAYNLVMPDQHAGWQFNEDAYDGNSILPGHQVMNPADAAAITEAELREEPFFERFIAAGQGQASRFSDYDGNVLFAPQGDAVASDQAGQKETQYKLLAEAIPALSFAAAANTVNVLGETRNIHMQTLRSGWPQNRLDDPELGNNWLHSDMKNIAFPYISQFYDRVVQEGGLQ